jgi:hypothetical protein
MKKLNRYWNASFSRVQWEFNSSAKKLLIITVSMQYLGWRYQYINVPYFKIKTDIFKKYGRKCTNAPLSNPDMQGCLHLHVYTAQPSYVKWVNVTAEWNKKFSTAACGYGNLPHVQKNEQA